MKTIARDRLPGMAVELRTVKTIPLQAKILSIIFDRHKPGYEIADRPGTGALLALNQSRFDFYAAFLRVKQNKIAAAVHTSQKIDQLLMHCGSPPLGRIKARNRGANRVRLACASPSKWHWQGTRSRFPANKPPGQSDRCQTCRNQASEADRAWPSKKLYKLRRRAAQEDRHSGPASFSRTKPRSDAARVRTMPARTDVRCCLVLWLGPRSIRAPPSDRRRSRCPAAKFPGCIDPIGL